MTCNQFDQIWIESGVSEDAVSSHIQIMVPGQTACFLCATPLAVVENNEGTIKREGVCAASLPTTMGITAGFMAQNALKLLLEFGDLAFCLSYNARMDFFQNYKILPNPDCKDKECTKKQEEKRGKEGFVEKREKKMKEKERKEKNEAPLHQENEWGIEVMQETIEEPQVEMLEVNEEERKEESLEELMNRLKGL